MTDTESIVSQDVKPGTSSPSTFSPLSFAQQRLWFLAQLAPHNAFYTIHAAIRCSGTLDRAALERSLQTIVRRHAPLRTTFTTVDGQPIQVITTDRTVQLSVVNLQSVALVEREPMGQQLAIAEAQRPFNLTTDLPFRVAVLQFDPTESILLLTLHHIVADGWSLGVLIQELAICYAAFLEGRSPVLPPLPIQYTDFVQWQRNWLQGDVLERQLAYWRRQLQDLPMLELPSDRPRPAVQSYRGATCPLHISPTVTQVLATLSQDTGTSLFMTLLAAFQTVLHRYTGQTDIAIGSPIANRHRREVEGLIGFFVNSLVMRSDLSGNPTFRELLERVRETALAAYEHQDLPFEKLVEELDPYRDLSRNPLFQVAFALQNAPMQSLELPGLALTPMPLESSSTRFALEVHLWEPAHGLRSLWRSHDGLSGFIAYSTDLFDGDRIQRLVGHFQTLLEGIAANPDAHLSDLPLLTFAEQQQIQREWNQPNDCNSKYHYFHHIFEAQVNATPNAIALISDQTSLTYQELNQRADCLAHVLQQRGVQPDTLVGLCVDRSVDMVVGILGILKAGGAYVLLDPQYPGDRLQFMLADTQVSILLTQSWLVGKLPPSQAQIFCLDQPFVEPVAPFVPQPKPEGLTQTSHADGENASDRLAYVIYTSGSTGTPKGVLLTHRGLCNVVEAQWQLFHPSRTSRVLQASSISFDASVFEIALAFGCGGTLCIPPRSAQLPGMELLHFLKQAQITHALITPAVLAVLPPAELPDLQVLITGGEACSSQVIDRWAVNRRFFNAYGPTETTIWATAAELHPGDSPRLIGRPTLNSLVYILDANQNLLPAGIPGELCIGGEGIARGYLHRPALTVERFVDFGLPILDFGLHPEQPNPKSKIQNPKSLRLYRTGDRALFHPDGSLEFLGRVDQQIKIRGFRVELGEIEAALHRHPAIQDAAVIVSGDASNEKRLIAYVCLNYEHSQRHQFQALEQQMIRQWQVLYEETYEGRGQKAEGRGQGAEGRGQGVGGRRGDGLFDTTGWRSSYTGEDIPLEQMREWVGDRLHQIRALKPERILEIGCGKGLLLFQLASHCQTYVGTDFSREALASIDCQLASADLSNVVLLHRMATDFQGMDRASFDTVILNSIVQYFPSVDYLLRVLEGAMEVVAPGGVVFVGDVRSLPLLKVFHAWRQFCQADAEMERDQLHQRVERSHFEEPELAIDPAFFHALRHRFPQIRHVQIRLLRGNHDNEMTQFRYNVLLHIKDHSEQTISTFHAKPDHNWQQLPLSVDQIQQHLVETKPEVFILANVANRRVHDAINVATWLQHQASPKTVGSMREQLRNPDKESISPQEWWRLETTIPYTVEITGSEQTRFGSYDVQFIRQGCEKPIDRPAPQPLRPSWYQYTNHPLRAHAVRQLIPELQQSLKQTLPDYMVPAAFVPLEALPLTPNGKVDRPALTARHDHTLRVAEPAIASPPHSPTEQTLTALWKDLLRLHTIHRHDNFFELGGHSLLATQMTSRIRETFGLELPLQKVFEAPTIAQLAPLLDTLQTTQTTPKIPPITPLDRSERSPYRRQRSSLFNGQKQLLEVRQRAEGRGQRVEGTPYPTPYTPHPTPHTPHPTPTHPPIHPSTPPSPRSPLIPLALGSNKPPFFCVHPMFGVVFPYLELAQQLGGDRSFYGLQPLGLDGKAAPLNRMEAIAAYYVQAIQDRQPQGPYFLGGWSFGGLVAFEMAQQLTQSGQEVRLLAIFDTPAPRYQPSFVQSLRFLLGTALWSTLPFLRDYGALATQKLPVAQPWLARWQWSAILRQLPEASRLALLDESAIAPLLSIVRANAQAAYGYRPHPYPHTLTLFKATETPISGKNPTLGWDALTPHLQLHPVPGNHLSLLKQPHVQVLAHHLTQYLY